MNVFILSILYIPVKLPIDVEPGRRHYYSPLLRNTSMLILAARVGERTAFFLSGELIELDNTQKLFTSPADKRTDGYISGKFG